MEKIAINLLYEDLKQDEEFEYSCEDESPEWALSVTLDDAMDYSGKFNKNHSFPEFAFKLVDAYNLKGDGKDESTSYGVFERKSDNKYFLIWIHDNGQLGPTCLSVRPEMVEIKKVK